MIFDGYPRNLKQAKNLHFLMDQYNQKISCVFSLKVDQYIVIKRIIGRQICSKCGLIFNKFFGPATEKNHRCDSKFLQKRSDDNEKTIKKRIAIYKKEILSIFNYYKGQNLLCEVDGMKDIAAIYGEICQINNLTKA